LGLPQEPVVLAEVSWLIRLPLAGCVAAVVAVTAIAWWARVEAGSAEQLARCIYGSVIAGSALAFAASFLTVHRTADAARLANGANIGGSVVRVEHLWPRQPGRLRILHGNGRVRRGAVLLLEGGQPVR
jgi:hypothetical protein